MSDLSFLIENQKDVQVDESYLEKIKKEESSRSKGSPSHGPTRVLSSKEIKINTNFLPNSRKANSPRSYNMKNFSSFKSEPSDANEEIFKIDARVNALGQNYKRLELGFSKRFSEIQSCLYSQKNEHSERMEELESIRNEILLSKKLIGNVLNDITRPK